MDKCKGGEDTRTTSITGRLSGRGRESYKRKMVGYRLRISQEIKRKISSLRQFLSLLSFLYVVSEALTKHFALIQRLKTIALLNVMTKCRNVSYENHEVPAQQAQMFDIPKLKS